MAKRRRVAYKGRGHGVPSLICTATSKATGERCRKFAIVGSTVCNMHGVTGAVQDNADRRVTYAQLVGDDRRHPQEILLDMVHKADVITRVFEADILAANGDGTIDVDQREQLVQMIRTTHGLAAQTIGTRAYDDAAHAFTQHLELQGRMVGIAIDGIVRGLTRSLDTEHGDRLRTWALAQAHNVLVAAEDGEPAEVPDVEPPPFALAAIADDVDTGEHDGAPRHHHAIGGWVALRRRTPQGRRAGRAGRSRADRTQPEDPRIMSVFDRLKTAFASDVSDDRADGTGATDDDSPDPREDVRSGQLPGSEASTLPAAANHVPDAAREFDVWGRHEPSTVGARLWVETMLGSQRNQ